MPSTYSTNLRLELIATGEKSGTWGTTTNVNLGTLIEEAVGGYVSISMTDADYTLTTNNGSSDEARNATLKLNGSLSTTRNVICPAIEKTYLVWNATNQSIIFKCAATSGVTIPSGSKAVVFVDGTTVRDVISVPVPVALGGTGAATASDARTALGVPGLSSANTFTSNQIISVSSSSDALRITQTGAGNALVVEDSANPDATPFVVKADGSMFVGSTGGEYGRDTWIGAFRRDQNSDTEFGLINNFSGTSASATFTRATATAFAFNTWSFFDNNGAPYDVFSYGAPVTHVMWLWAGSEKFRFANTGALGFGGQNYGTSGQVLISGGSSASPAWGTLSVSGGGTGATDAATARTNLGVAIGTNVQAYDATLQSLSALGTAADKYAYTTGVDTWAEGTITAAGRAILDDADASAQRTTLGLGTAATLNVGTSANNVVQLDGTAKLPAVDGSQLTNLPSAPSSGRLLRSPQILTSGTSYTTPAGCNAIYVELQGGGGGGGKNNFGGRIGGGGAGAYAAKYFTVSPSTAYTYAIGAGGSVSGGSGGSTTLTVGATTVTAGGGVGGGSNTSGGSGGTATNGDLNIGGQSGGSGENNTVEVSGGGGDSFFGFGGKRTVEGIGSSGQSGIGYGSGGAGNIAAGADGGAGAPGLIRIWEYA